MSTQVNFITTGGVTHTPTNKQEESHSSEKMLQMAAKVGGGSEIGAKTLQGKDVSQVSAAELAKKQKLRQKMQDAGQTIIKIQKGLNKIHSQGYTGLSIDKSYWPEFLTHYGKEFSMALKKDYYDKSKTKLSFVEWLDSKESFGARLTVVDSLRSTTTLYNMDSGKEGIHPVTKKKVPKFDMNKMRVAYLNEEQRQAYKVHFTSTEDGRAVLLNHKEAAMNGSFICVMGPDGSLYAGKKITNRFHHSSFLAGAAAIFAGSIATKADKDGTVVITEITDQSGHYRSAKQNMLEFLDVLIKKKQLTVEQLAKITIKFNCLRPDADEEHYNALEFYSSKGACKPFEVILTSGAHKH